MQAPLSQRHAFLSYMHEDKEQVDELQEALEALGIQVWRDTKDLWPGEDWESKIRSAIKADALAFIACFSNAAAEREKSYQYEELTLAVDEYRLRKPNASWLFTVRFDDCAIPELVLGAGRTLASSIQRTDFFGPGKTVQTIRLTQAVAKVMNPPSVPSVTTEAVAEAKLALSDSRGRADYIKQLLREPSADILLEDFMSSLGSGVRSALADDIRFSVTSPHTDWVQLSGVWLKQVHQYEKAVEPVLDLVRLAAMYGQPSHNAAWERFMRNFTARPRRDAGLAPLVNLRGYPGLLVIYVAAIASTSRRNYVPLQAFVCEPTLRDDFDNREHVPMLLSTNVRAVASDADAIASALALSDDGREINDELIQGLVGKQIGGRHTPLSDHLHSILRDLFRDEFSDDREFSDAFDRAEVLLDALSVDAAEQSGKSRGWRGGYGRYTWRNKDAHVPVETRMLNKLNEQAAGWAPVLDGLFGGSVDRAKAALELVSKNALQVRSGQW